MSQVTIGDLTLNFKDTPFTGDQWEQVASWVLNGGGESAAESASVALQAASNAAKASATATDNADSAKSYAVGGTGTREGEDTDNAKYYCEQAHAIAGEGLVFSVNGQQADEAGNVNVTKESIGLDKVNNTADTEKPVSLAQQQALDELNNNKAPLFHAEQHRKDGSDPLTAADIDAAPAGYGLGNSQLIAVAEIDTTTAPGWYHIDENTAVTLCGVSSKVWRFIVDAVGNGGTHCRQTAITPTGVVIQRVRTSGAWLEWTPYLEAIGAIPLTGGTLTGGITIDRASQAGYATVTTFANMLAMYAIEADGTDQRVLILRNGQNMSLENALQLQDREGGVTKTYNVYGEHNKPTGTYTGNGSTAERKIATGGMGSAVLMWGNGYMGFVLETSSIFFGSGGGTNVSSYYTEKITYAGGSGTITITDSNTRFNANGVEYGWLII